MSSRVWEGTKIRLDHVAYRVKDRHKAAEFFCKEPFNYKIQTEFEIPELCTKCLALRPPERRGNLVYAENSLPFLHPLFFDVMLTDGTDYHLAPEIFISSSDDPNSPVGKWVSERNGGGIHHLAFNVNDVAAMMEKRKAEGWEFTTEKPIVDEDLTQCFTKPIEVLGGVIIEFINRPSERGFSVKNVKDLMKSTNGMR